MIVESTKADIKQVLKELDDKLMQRTTRTPNTFVPPDRDDYQRPYTSLSQFQPVRPPIYQNPSRTRQVLHTNDAADRNSQEPCVHTPRGRQPNQFVQITASRQTSIAATHHTTTPNSGSGHRRQLGTKHTFNRPIGRQPLQPAPQAAPNRPTPEVVLKSKVINVGSDTFGNFLCQKSSESFSIFFSLKNINLEAHFLLLAFFDKINFLTTLLLK